MVFVLIVILAASEEEDGARSAPVRPGDAGAGYGGLPVGRFGDGQPREQYDQSTPDGSRSSNSEFIYLQ